jgi:hypothetical protein
VTFGGGSPAVFSNGTVCPITTMYVVAIIVLLVIIAWAVTDLFHPSSMHSLERALSRADYARATREGKLIRETVHA